MIKVCMASARLVVVVIFIITVIACPGPSPEQTFTEYCWARARCKSSSTNADVRACIDERLRWVEIASASDSPVECPGFRDDLFTHSDCMILNGECIDSEPYFVSERCSVFDPNTYACSALRDAGEG